MKQTIVTGVDFSIKKPTICILSNNIYSFISWPHNLPNKILNIFLESGVQIIDRLDIKEEKNDLSSKMRYEVQNAQYLANLILESIQLYLINSDTYIAYEGLSYSSLGDRSIQLGAYKYILMNELSKYIPLKNMYTYSPQTIKSVAGCAKKGMGKKEMIDAFIQNGPLNCKLRESLLENPEKFQTSRAKNWIPLLDDLCDGYWTLETLLKKESFLL